MESKTWEHWEVHIIIIIIIIYKKADLNVMDALR